MLPIRLLLVSWLALAPACQSASQDTAPPVGTPATAASEPPTCDCCVFNERRPTSWRTRIAPDTAAGTPLRITGTVYESDGRTPAPNVAMYFYQTNARGRYAKLGTEPPTSHAWWHGYSRGWLRTDVQGRYELRTVKPGPYPGRTIPAHIHFYVKAPSQRQCYYLSDFVFAGDPFLTESYWAKLEQSDGFPRYGGVALTLHQDTLVGQRDIRLLPQFDRRPTQSGLLVGQECPSFQPWHVWGPDEGKRTCPMCAYGSGEGVLIWTRSVTSDTLRRMARYWESQLQRRGPRPLRAFIIYTNPERKPAAAVRQLLERFARQARLREVAVVYVPAPDDNESAFLYSINPAVTITVLGYKQRQIVSRFIDPAATDRELQAHLFSLK
ncbi:protocatechuate 3,4-dioxygenase beta subunit [Hymenobacter daecheongensis DSM 21074]|uniref:Protocatechuate 3,4-dioxygenase beta subunit n=1 Tax=Hymenobacter daecheongensis DSM 21074 TaxID=1121955 RepID=A0A1M6CR64_9BACT|nr:hypothetical protein [Hymenobacter daecheongensis]SHI63449.1 protocatechuate 3,4-dioxygenase beta subunit [Hymenobacter daecheongensis DSM 21074]